LESVVQNSLRGHLEDYVRQCVQGGVQYKDALFQLEMEYVMQILGQTHFNVSRTAKILGINRNTLSKKISDYEQFEIFRDFQKVYGSR